MKRAKRLTKRERKGQRPEERRMKPNERKAMRELRVIVDDPYAVLDHRKTQVPAEPIPHEQMVDLVNGVMMLLNREARERIE